jgi:hypothetical protein
MARRFFCIPKHIVSIALMFREFSLNIFNADTLKNIRLPVSYVRQKCLETLDLVTNLDGATRSSFNEEEIEPLRQIAASDADQNVADRGRCLLQSLEEERNG